MATNPFIGTGWSTTPQPGPFQSPGIFALPQGQLPTPPTSPLGNPGGLPNPSSNIKDINRNAGYENVIQGQLRNALVPLFSNLLQGYAGQAANQAGVASGTAGQALDTANQAGNFYRNLTNLGSPFFGAKNTQAFTQGTQQGNDAMALARDRLNSAGTGYSPSGLEAATIGNLAQTQNQTISEQLLQNLFQNEGLQLQGAQGLTNVGGLQTQIGGLQTDIGRLAEALASLFNPAGILGNIAGGQSTQGPAASGVFRDILSALNPSGQAGPVSFGGAGA